MNTNHSEDVGSQPEQHAQSIMMTLDGCMKTFTRLSGGTPTLFLENICDKLLYTGEDNVTADGCACLERHISQFEKLQSQVYALESELLSLVGVRAEIIILKDAAHRISHIISCLEDIWCCSTEGYHILDEMHRKGKLLYQA